MISMKDKKAIRRLNVAKLSAAGIPDKKISEELNITQATVKREKKTPECQALVKKMSASLEDYIPKAIQNMGKAIDSFTPLMDDPNAQDSKVRISYQATKDLLQAQGYLAGNISHVTNIQINKQTNMIPPIMMEMLQKFVGGMIEEDIIDVVSD